MVQKTWGDATERAEIERVNVLDAWGSCLFPVSCRESVLLTRESTMSSFAGWAFRQPFLKSHRAVKQLLWANGETQWGLSRVRFRSMDGHREGFARCDTRGPRPRWLCACISSPMSHSLILPVFVIPYVSLCLPWVPVFIIPRDCDVEIW
ncbi:hypothetical protein GE21DRAFT_1067787 [Neurospora crassa]|nr:hypothetical protein GE21DRAFT_1067787 [Neurospora crassa]